MTNEQAAYYPTLDKNFENAYTLIQMELSHNQLLDMLKYGTIAERQLSALELKTIKSEIEAYILLSNLTGQDGKIREAVSLKINEFLKKDELKKLFCPDKNYKTFLNAVIDINGNVCRNIISGICNFKNDEVFCSLFCKELINKTFEILEIVKDFDFQEGKYKVNKEVFKLYWYLETIYEFYNFVEFNALKKIIKTSKSIEEYTIREKTAKILTRDFEDEELKTIKNELKSDKNYFVRRY